MEILDKDCSPLVDFYQNKTVFITGGTGFVGTGLVEKILYVCKDIKKIYVLIKPSYENCIEEKMKKWINSTAFERLKSSDPDAIKKIIPIKGNICAENFALSGDVIKTIQEEVEIVFHVAASVVFDKPVSEAILTNTKASEKMIKLCKGIRQLEALVYVSTAYCNTNKNILFEKVYTTNISLKEVEYLLNNRLNDHMTDQLLGGRPNTYVFSKALSEELFANEIKKMPITIVRPSIIISALREPCPGWLKGWSGVNVGTTVIGNNILRCTKGDNNLVFDLVPLDHTVNLTLAAAWDISKVWKTNTDEVKVFNICSGLQNPVTFGEYSRTCKKHLARNSWLPFCFPPLVIKNRLLYYIMFFIVQTIPDTILISLNWLTGGYISFINRMLIKKGYVNVIKHLEFYSSNEYTFVDFNVKNLYNKMDVKDKVLFDFDTSKIHWNSYLKLYTEAVEKYLLSK